MGQAVTAVTLVAVLGVGLWALGEIGETPRSDTALAPAACSGGEPEKAPGEGGKAPRHVSGAQLCQALNRPDLAELLGTPEEIAKTASGDGGSLELAGGEAIATPSARVEFDTYTVTLSATYDRLPVAGSAALLGGDARQRTVLGRPAVIYSGHTLRISFRLDGSDADSGPGVPARALAVAQDAKDSGGSFEVTLWRSGGGIPNDVVLHRIAEKVLPTVPGWTATE
ncbi:DUF6215 domain-containing protein [Streptomyces sp. NPDC006551]|uniref:DUF6215 domain-containing protein n=1 Tax=Streptomyces sp. NPDC006551 TaxID=3157178 RepID=UPI0033BBD720